MQTHRPAGSEKRNIHARGILKSLAGFKVLLAFVLICLFLSVSTRNFLTVQNLLIVLRQISLNGILAVGVTFVIIAGGIDLSLGSVVALSGVAAASFAHPDTYPVILPVTVGILTGVIVGLFNGVVITRAKVAPFIVTLGMMTIARGLALVVSDGRPVSDLSKAFNFIGGGTLLYIPVPILIFAVVIFISAIILRRTKTGRYIYAVGGNEHAAKASGVNVVSTKLFTYIACSGLAGLAGVVLASRITTGQPNAGVAYELDAIAAVVIGGTSLSGGVGTVTGTVIGALIIGVINNGLDLMNISSYYQQIVKGLIIIIAVIIDRNTIK